MHYVIGDIHGCYHEMISLIHKIKKRDQAPIIYFLGDFIDRGKYVWDVLQWMLENITPDGPYRCLRGNHEEYVIEWYSDWLMWYKNPIYTMPETGFDFSRWADAADYLHPHKLEPIINFFASLPLETVLDIKIINNQKIRYHLAHAYPSFGRKFSKEYEYKEFVLCNRKLENNAYNDDVAVIGHTPTIFYKSSRPGLIDYMHNVINVDGGAVFQNENRYYPCMLCAICLETLEEIYCDSIEKRIKMANPTQGDEEISDIIEKYHNKYLSTESKYRMELLKKYGLD